MCNVGILYNGDANSMVDKKRTKSNMFACKNQFNICIDPSFSTKDVKCGFGCAIFFKGATVYGGSVRGGAYSSCKEAEDTLHPKESWGIPFRCDPHFD